MYRYLLLLTVAMGCHPQSASSTYRWTPDEGYKVPYANQLASLAVEWEGVASHHHATVDTDDVLTELHDAFVAACKADGVDPDLQKWLRYQSNVTVVGDLDAIYAKLEEAPNGQFADALKHIDVARRGLTTIERMTERSMCETVKLESWSYITLERELDEARVLLSTAAPADTPWDAKGTLARIDAAIATLDKANIEPEKDRVRYFGPPPAENYRDVSYHTRLVMARDIIEMAAKDLEADTSATARKGPRKQVLAQVDKIVDALDGAVALGAPAKAPAKVVSADETR